MSICNIINFVIYNRNEYKIVFYQDKKADLNYFFSLISAVFFYHEGAQRISLSNTKEKCCSWGCFLASLVAMTLAQTPHCVRG